MLNKTLWKESLKNRRYLCMLVIFTLGTGILILSQAEIFSFVVNAVFIEKKNQGELTEIFLWFLGLLLFRTMYGYVTESYFKLCALKIKRNFREKLFAFFLNQGPVPLKNQKTGENITLLGEGMEWLVPYYAQYIPQLFQVAIVPLFICSTVFFRDKISAVVMLITAPLIPIFMILIGGKAKALNEKQWKKLTILSSHLLDVLQGFKTLLIFGRSKSQEEKIYEVSENFRKSTMEVLRVSFLSALVLELCATISTAVIAVGLGLRLVYGQISFRDGFFVLLLAPEFYLPFRQLGMKFHVSMNGEAVAKSIEKLLENKNEEIENKDGQLVDGKFLEKGIGIEIEGVSYTYKGMEKPALQDLSFSVKPGEKVAIVGKSGSGKSTILNILMGFIKPQKGSIKINGIRIEKLNLESWRNAISYVPQKSHLFNGTFEENIRMGNREASMEKVQIAANFAKAHEFIDLFEKKYLTMVGEGEEVKCSGGEIQRISISRAFLKNAPFVILDEPTSGLDAEGQEKVNIALETLSKGRTVFQIAHRLSTAKKADKILVMEEGKLVEWGNHETLLRQKGKYHEMVKDREDRG